VKDPSRPPAVQAHTAHSVYTPDLDARTEPATVTAGLEGCSSLIPFVRLREEREDASSGDDRSEAETKETLTAAAGEETDEPRHSREVPQVVATQSLSAEIADSQSEVENDAGGGTSKRSSCLVSSVFADSADDADENEAGREDGIYTLRSQTVSCPRERSAALIRLRPAHLEFRVKSENNHVRFAAENVLENLLD
jgi:hypothetical protein